MTDNNETTAQRARRLAKDYANEYLSDWKPHDRKWMRYAFTKGYQASCVDQAAEVAAIDVAIVKWEQDGDAEALVQVIDEWLERIEGRAA